MTNMDNQEHLKCANAGFVAVQIHFNCNSRNMTVVITTKTYKIELTLSLKKL